jgi:hypothetical protein
MAIQLTFPNIIHLFSAIAPLLVVFFMVTISLFNQNLKGLVYLAGLMISLVINIPIANMISGNTGWNRVKPDALVSCNIISIPYITEFNSPGPSALLLGFTLAYLAQPMIMNNQINYVVLAFLSGLLGIDISTKVTMQCTTLGGAVLGALIGMFMAVIWYSLFKSAGFDSLLYFDEMQSNSVRCSQPAKQTFKCAVYKNGELISSSTV